jgi:hypothetical protein
MRQEGCMGQKQSSTIKDGIVPVDLDGGTTDVSPEVSELGQPERGLTERHIEFMTSYSVPSEYGYVFNNPGYVITPQIKNPEDKRRIDTSGDTWRMGTERPMKWDDIALYRPLKELAKGYIHNLLDTSGYLNAVGAFSRLKCIQWLFAEAGEYPLSEPKWLTILAELRERSKEFGLVRDLYRFGVECGAPGFNRLTLAKVERMHAAAVPQYLGVKNRHHVLTDAENRAIRKALEDVDFEPLPRLPNKHRPNALYPLDSLIKLMGLPKPYKDHRNKGSKSIFLNYHGTLNSAHRAGLQEISTPSTGVNHGKGMAAYEFRGSDIAHVLEERKRAALLRNWYKLQTNIITHINYALGARPDQIEGVNEGGFGVEKSENGVAFYRIALPRRKQGTAAPEYRSRPIPDHLGQKIEQLLRMKHELFGDHGPLSPLFVMIDGARMRRAEMMIRKYLASIDLNGRNAMSLRHNVGQRMADEGWPAAVIKEVLDHSTLRAVRFYVEASLKMSEFMDKALANHEDYADLYGKLHGTIKIVKPEDVRPSDSVVIPIINRQILSGIGLCGRGDKPCGDDPGISCYGCKSFQPFDEIGIHLKAEAALLSEIQEFVDISRDGGFPSQQAFVHRDSLAAIHVIINEIEGQKEKGDNE